MVSKIGHGGVVGVSFEVPLAQYKDLTFVGLHSMLSES